MKLKRLLANRKFLLTSNIVLVGIVLILLGIIINHSQKYTQSKLHTTIENIEENISEEEKEIIQNIESKEINEKNELSQILNEQQVVKSEEKQKDTALIGEKKQEQKKEIVKSPAERKIKSQQNVEKKQIVSNFVAQIGAFSNFEKANSQCKKAIKENSIVVNKFKVSCITKKSGTMIKSFFKGFSNKSITSEFCKKLSKTSCLVTEMK